MVSDDVAELSRALEHPSADLFLVIGGVGMGSVPAFGGVLVIVGFFLGVVGTRSYRPTGDPPSLRRSLRARRDGR